MCLCVQEDSDKAMVGFFTFSEVHLKLKTDWQTVVESLKRNTENSSVQVSGIL